MLTHMLHPRGSTGNSRAYIDNLNDATRIEVEFEVEAIGGAPTVTFVIEGCFPDSDPTVAANWITLATLTGLTTDAASAAPIVVTTVSKVRRYIDGLTYRFYRAIAITTSANNNVTYNSKLNRADYAT